MAAERASRVLVTGGAGFIGSHLVEGLLSEGFAVRVLDNLSTGQRSNLSFVRGLPTEQFELFQADLEDDDARARAVAGVGTIFHLAALPSVARSVAEPLESHLVNATGTLALLVDAQEAGVERVVYASSSSVYGESAVLPKKEEMRPDPCSPYAVAKLTGEYYCSIFDRTYEMACVALRYFNVFGPRQRPDSDYAAVIPRFLQALTAGEPPVIYGDGLQTRDFTFVGDIVAANLRAMRAPREACGNAYNVACGREVSLLGLLEILQGILGSSVSPRFEAARAGDVRHSVADASRARTGLEWTPAVTLEEGLRRTLRGFAQERSHAT